jgi:hypothetical protein
LRERGTLTLGDVAAQPELIETHYARSCRRDNCHLAATEPAKSGVTTIDAEHQPITAIQLHHRYSQPNQAPSTRPTPPGGACANAERSPLLTPGRQPRYEACRDVGAGRVGGGGRQARRSLSGGCSERKADVTSRGFRSPGAAALGRVRADRRTRARSRARQYRATGCLRESRGVRRACYDLTSWSVQQ